MPFCNGCGASCSDKLCSNCLDTIEHVCVWLNTLELEPGASQVQIKQAFRDLAKVWHPDRFNGDDRVKGRAHEKFSQINGAYRLLRKHSQIVIFLENYVRNHQT